MTCTACLPDLPILYQGECYSLCPPGTESAPSDSGTCVEVPPGRSPPPSPPPNSVFPPPAPVLLPTPGATQPPRGSFAGALCFDRILNGGEEFTDCGGPCPVCSAYLDVQLSLLVSGLVLCIACAGF